jgi:hypothetical protein
MRNIDKIEDLPKCPFCGNGIRPDKYTKHVSTICNKRTNPNPYSDILPRQEIPPWLLKILDKKQLPNIVPLTEILLNSCYYPCSGFDTSPVYITNGHIHSFVYSDYSINPIDYKNTFEKTLFKGYQKILQRPIEKNEVLPSDWKMEMPKDFYISQGFINLSNIQKQWKTYGEWSIWKLMDNCNGLIGPEYFSLLFVPSDAIITYKELYARNHITPDVLSIIQPGGHGKGGNNWTSIANKDGYFWHIIKKQGTPYYLFDNGFGNSGNKIICPFDNYRFLGSIKKEEQGIPKYIDEKRPNIYLGDTYSDDIINIYKIYEDYAN